MEFSALGVCDPSHCRHICEPGEEYRLSVCDRCSCRQDEPDFPTSLLEHASRPSWPERGHAHLHLIRRRIQAHRGRVNLGDLGDSLRTAAVMDVMDCENKLV